MGGDEISGDGTIGRVLAIDYGHVRVGLAMSDPLGMFAVGLETLNVTSLKDTLAHIQALCAEHGVVQLVLGLPKNMDGSEGPMAEKVRDFAERLTSETHLPVLFIDERLTSKLAEQTLRDQGIKASRNKGLIDEAAARRLLQDYLDAKA
ncbi:MAG: Holliday junction resolvase RuvX [Candidatus Melainabacteria bacterium]